MRKVSPANESFEAQVQVNQISRARVEVSVTGPQVSGLTAQLEPRPNSARFTWACPEHLVKGKRAAPRGGKGPVRKESQKEPRSADDFKQFECSIKVDERNLSLQALSAGIWMGPVIADK